MKKVLSLLLIGVLSFSLIGCGSDDKDGKKDTTPKTEEKEKEEKKDKEKDKKKDVPSAFRTKGYKEFNGNYRLDLNSSGNSMTILFTFYGGDCKNDMVSIAYNSNPEINIVYNQNYGAIDTCRYDYVNNTFISGYEGSEDQKQQIINGKSNFDDMLKDLDLTIEDLNNYSANK